MAERILNHKNLPLCVSVYVHFIIKIPGGDVDVEINMEVSGEAGTPKNDSSTILPLLKRQRVKSHSQTVKLNQCVSCMRIITTCVQKKECAPVWTLHMHGSLLNKIIDTSPFDTQAGFSQNFVDQ